MAREYDFSAIEKKWQAYWEKNGTFKAVDFSPKPKFYCSSDKRTIFEQAVLSAGSQANS